LTIDRIASGPRKTGRPPWSAADVARATTVRTVRIDVRASGQVKQVPQEAARACPRSVNRHREGRGPWRSMGG